MIHISAYAKINWSLRITGKRADGFHDLETLFQTISLHDTLTFEESDRLTLTCDDPSIPVDDSNLVLRAARALARRRWRSSYGRPFPQAADSEADRPMRPQR